MENYTKVKTTNNGVDTNYINTLDNTLDKQTMPASLGEYWCRCWPALSLRLPRELSIGG
jgi:hypothetical protein